MVAMRMANFGGMVPLISPPLLPDNMAFVAVNAYLRGGEVRGIRQPLEIKNYPTGVGDPIYKKAVRIPDPTDLDVPVWVPLLSRSADLYPNPLVNDSFNRFIWLDENQRGTPQPLRQNSLAGIKAASPPILLGVPPPALAPSVTLAGGTVLTVTRSYVYTYVNQFGEEGQPSPAVTTSGFSDATWNVAGIVNPAFATVRGITKVRIYRTVSGTQGTAFYRVAEQNVGVATYADTRTDSAVATDALILASETWAVPPDMEGILSLPNGFFAGWSGKDLFFSEPYRPWAWPAEYTLSTDYPIVDCGVVEQTLIALTETTPTFFTGVSPSGMTEATPAGLEPCASADSIVRAPEGIYYASQNGLILLSSAGMVNITREVIGRDTWVAEYLARIRSAVAFDSQYIAMSDNGDGFVFDPRGIQSGIIQIANFPDVENLWADPYTAEAHLIVGNKVYSWNAPESPFAVAEWISKDFLLPGELNFGAIQATLDPTYSIGTIPDPIIGEAGNLPGGPWTTLSNIINYNRIHGPTIHAAPAWNSAPPGNPTAAVWPYWVGVVASDAVFDLPEGAACLISVFADYRLVWQQYVTSGQVYRLPSGFKSANWRIQIKTRVPVRNVQIAQTSKELRVV